MMKIRHNFKLHRSLILSLILLLSSCKGFLYVEPTNILSVNSYDDVRAMLGTEMLVFKECNTWYNRDIKIPYYHRQDYLIFSFYSDDLLLSRYLGNWKGRNNRGDFNRSIEWKHPSIHEELWSHYYSCIGYNNMILDQLAKFPGETEAKTNEVKAEAMVIRAYAFFKLMQLFSPYHHNELGLPLNTDSDKVGSYDKRRKTQVENYKFVIGQLETVLALETPPSKTFNLFFSPQIIHAILAQVYLYKGDSGAKEATDYENATLHAQKSLELSGITSKTINRLPSSTDDFGYSTTKDYALLSFITSDDDRFSNITGKPSWSLELSQYATPELIALFPDNDLRKKMWFKEVKKGEWQIFKFENSSFPYSFCKVDLFTAAELELIIAEALARSGRDSEAEQALQKFTANRYEGGYTAPVGKTLLQQILDERRKEFCFEESFRWIDLTRLQPTFERKLKSKSEEKTYTIKEHDFRYTLPIPVQAELSENKIEQNPGWGQF